MDTQLRIQAGTQKQKHTRMHTRMHGPTHGHTYVHTYMLTDPHTHTPIISAQPTGWGPVRHTQ